MPNELILEITVHKSGPFTFTGVNANNPYDNEHPDVNGDGVQLYHADPRGATAWMLVPDSHANKDGSVRARHIEGWDLPRPHASWHPVDGGYAMTVRVPLARQLQTGSVFSLGLVVNEKPAGRERRRGQLVLGGAGGEFVYLRGDREDLDRLPRFRVIS
jgi:hypothetical protein